MLLVHVLCYHPRIHWHYIHNLCQKPSQSSGLPGIESHHNWQPRQVMHSTLPPDRSLCCLAADSVGPAVAMVAPAEAVAPSVEATVPEAAETIVAQHVEAAAPMTVAVQDTEVGGPETAVAVQRIEVGGPEVAAIRIAAAEAIVALHAGVVVPVDTPIPVPSVRVLAAGAVEVMAQAVLPGLAVQDRGSAGSSQEVAVWTDVEASCEEPARPESENL